MRKFKSCFNNSYIVSVGNGHGFLNLLYLLQNLLYLKSEWMKWADLFMLIYKFRNTKSFQENLVPEIWAKCSWQIRLQDIQINYISRTKLWKSLSFYMLVQIHGKQKLIDWKTEVDCIITTAQLHSTKPELRFRAGLNPACGVSEICNGEDLWHWSRLEIMLNVCHQSTIPQK